MSELRDQIAGLIRDAMANDPAHVISKDTRATVAERYADLVMTLLPGGQPATTALRNLLDHYVQLVDSGDCGNWDAETEDVVIAARHALQGQPDS